MTATDWMADAFCAEVDTDVFFPEKGGTATPARSICRRCPVQLQCLTYALEAEVDEGLHLHGGGPYGIYAGLTGRDRRELVRARRNRQIGGAA